MECVAVLLEEKTEWDYIKKVILGDASLLSRLKCLKGENITAKTKDKLVKKCNILIKKWKKYIIFFTCKSYFNKNVKKIHDFFHL